MILGVFKVSKVLGKGDLKVVKDNPGIKGSTIPRAEIQQVLMEINEVQYALYSVYRTVPFYEAEDITDINIAEVLNWTARKVQDNRRVLEQQNLLKVVRYGTKTEGITKLLVGMDVVALFNKGLPCEILDGKALQKLKKAFKIQSPRDLINKLDDILVEYETNPTKYIPS